jgi:hypothetical protein
MKLTNENSVDIHQYEGGPRTLDIVHADLVLLINRNMYNPIRIYTCQIKSHYGVLSKKTTM